MQQYKDLMAYINIESFPPERKAVSQYIRTVKLLKILAVIFLALELIAVILDSGIKNVAFVLMLLTIFIYLEFRTLSSKKIRGILLEECNPVKMLSFLGSLLNYSRRSRNWDEHFYNIAMALYYAGRFSDAEKILPLMKQYCPNAAGALRYEMIAADIAYYREDEVELAKHCEELNKIASGIRLKGVNRALYEEKMQYPYLLNGKLGGNYQALYNQYLHAQTMRGSMLGEVKRNYYLYVTASAMGEREKAEQHRQYVLQHGGTLWYKADLEKKPNT